MGSAENSLRSLQWFELSDTDLRAAKVLRGAEMYHLSCFHAQQAVEKAFKGFLAAAGKESGRTHQIGALVRDYLPGEEFSGLQPQRLDKYYISSRYPEMYEASASVPSSFVRRDAEEAIAVAEGTIDILKHWSQEFGVDFPGGQTSPSSEVEKLQVVDGKISARILQIEPEGLLIFHAGREKAVPAEVLGSHQNGFQSLEGKYVEMHFHGGRMTDFRDLGRISQSPEKKR